MLSLSILTSTNLESCKLVRQPLCQCNQSLITRAGSLDGSLEVRDYDEQATCSSRISSLLPAKAEGRNP